MDDMDLELAQRLVWEAVRSVVSQPDLIEDEGVTLYNIGLFTQNDREHFKGLLVRGIREAGYEINPKMIPADADDTPGRIIMVLPGESTKGNKP